MPDTTDNQTTSGGEGGGTPDPKLLAAWINGAAARVQEGLPLDDSGQWDPDHGKYGTPLGYAVEDGKLVQDSQTWSSIYKGLLGTAGFAVLGGLIGPELGGTAATTDAASSASPFAGSTDLASSGEASTAAGGPLTGTEAGSSLTSVAGGGSGGGSSMGGTLSKLFGMSGKSSPLSSIGDAIGGASQAAGQNRLNQEQLGLQAAGTELAQRKAAAQDTAREAYTTAGGSRSPFDPTRTTGPKFASSPAEQSTLAMLANQGKMRLMTPLSTITPSNVQQATGTTESTLGKIGDWLGPGLKVVGSLGKLFGL